MSSDHSNSNSNKPPSPQPADMQNRRGSVSSTFQQLFARSNSVAAAGTPVFPSAITTAAIQEQQRRRLSLSTTSTLGMTGTSPTSATGLARRASMSTNSDFDENAIDEEDCPSASRTAPVTPFARRMSFGTAATMRRPGGTSPGTANGRPTVQSHDAAASSEQQRGTDAVPLSPSDSATAPTSASASATSWKALASSTTEQSQPSSNSNYSAAAAPHTRPRATSDLFSATRTDQGFNWSEQLRSRAESIATGSRPSISFAAGMTGSPPRPAMPSPGSHERARSVSEMPVPPAQTPKPRSPPRDTRPKPDHFQERILKGDFYMD